MVLPISSVVLPISWFQTFTSRKPQKAYDESPLILNFFVAFMFIQLVTVIGTENITVTILTVLYSCLKKNIKRHVSTSYKGLERQSGQRIFTSVLSLTLDETRFQSLFDMPHIICRMTFTFIHEANGSKPTGRFHDIFF